MSEKGVVFRMSQKNTEDVKESKASLRRRRYERKKEQQERERRKRRAEIKRKKMQQNRIQKQQGFSFTDEDKEVKRPQTIWEKIAEKRLYPQLREMGDSYEAIDRFQRKRVLIALFFGFIMLILAIFVMDWFYYAIPIAIIASYKMQIKKVDDYYRAWKFERQMNFSKFTRLVIPYLKASGGNMALYTIFNKILQRLDNEADRNSLYRLMGEMSDNPSDIQPFLDYAERSSGTDMSHLFMSTIFDFQQTTFNTDVIDELGKIASEDMMNSIDEIIEMKLRRFNMFPTKVVMTSFILVVGLGAGILFHNLKDINIGSAEIATINDAPQVEMGGNNDGSGDGRGVPESLDTREEENEEDTELSEPEDESINVSDGDFDGDRFILSDGTVIDVNVYDEHRDGNGDCTIKANSDSNIYHVKGESQYYDNFANPTSMLCTKEEGLSQGYRPPKQVINDLN